MTQLILIRHGPTFWSEERRYQGSSDTELSPAGIRKIRSLAKRFSSAGADFLYTSPLKRAIRSAEILARRTKLKPRIDSRLCEMDFGEWEGKTAGELLKRRDKAFLAWTQKEKWLTPPGGESVFSFRRRVRLFFRNCLKKHPRQTVAIVAHGGVLRLMILEALRLPFPFFFSFRIDPASVTVVSAALEKPGQILILNSTRFPPKM